MSPPDGRTGLCVGSSLGKKADSSQAAASNCQCTGQLRSVPPGIAVSKGHTTGHFTGQVASATNKMQTKIRDKGGTCRLKEASETN